MTLDRSDRAVLAAGRAIRARERKEAKKARPKTVRPDAPGQRQPRKHDKPYLAWIRRLPCVAGVVAGYATWPNGGMCDKTIEAAHLRFSDATRGRVNSGLQQKPDDRFTTPLCKFHHAQQHLSSERIWWSLIGVDPGELCAALSAAYDAGQDGTEVVLRVQRRGESR